MSRALFALIDLWHRLGRHRVIVSLESVECSDHPTCIEVHAAVIVNVFR